MKNYKMKNLIVIISILIMFGCALTLAGAYDRIGYLFRYKTVDLKYNTNEETLKKHHITYQTVITQSLNYNGKNAKSNSAGLSKNDLTISSKGNIKNDAIDIQYPDDSNKNKNKYLNVYESILTISKAKDLFTDDIAVTDEKDSIMLNFDKPIKLYDFTRSIELSLLSSVYPLITNMIFEAYNKNGVKIMNFKQEIETSYKDAWYFTSFNLLANNTSNTIENLYLTGIEFVLPDYSRFYDENIAISISDIRCINSVKKRGWEKLPVKYEYAVFEKLPEESEWNIRIGDTPSVISEVGDYVPNDDSARVKNADNWFFEFNKDNLSEYEYLLIDFNQDFFVPTDNRLTALVKGRGMGEEIGFIFEDSRGIYYELSSGNLDFTDWKSLEFVSPASKYLSYVDKKTKTHFVKLLGLKVNPGYDGKIGIVIDDISSVIAD